MTKRYGAKVSPWITPKIFAFMGYNLWRHSALCLQRGFPTSSWNAHTTAFSFLQGFSHNFPDAAALRLVIVLTIFQALLGSTTLNALSTSPIWYLISCYSRSLYTACKSLLASIFVTTSGLFSSCGCYIFLWFFRFSFVVDYSCIVQVSNLFSFSNKRESGCRCIFACLY